MADDLSNRVIVVTGASSGIGAATAIACARAGMHVVVAARREARLVDLAERIRKLGRRAVPLVCDVDRDHDVDRLMERTVDEFGRLDVLFANAGAGLIAPVLDTTDQMMRQLFETNFYGTIRCIRAAMAVIRHRPVHAPDAHILICSSCVSEIALPQYGAYCATKAAQDSIAGSLRTELAHEGVHVSTVHPITTRTEFFDRAEERSPDRSDRVTRHDVFLQSAEHVAKKIVNCLRRPRPEVWPHPPTRFGVAVCTAFPGLTAWALGKIAQRS